MPLLNSSAGLLTKPNGVVTRTVNTVATHIGPAVRFINKCPRIAALHLPVFHHTKMITWAKKEANPLYPVPTVWGRKDFRRLIESIRK
jgi:hypothetical protein